MLVEVVRTMYAYSRWANARILEAAERLTEAQRRADGGASFGSIHDTLVHIMGAQWLYLERWRGTSPTAMLAADAFPHLAAIRDRWAQIDAETEQFITRLSDTHLGAVVAYVNTEGQRWAYPLWQQMLHQVNHATQHRSETAMVLTQLGQSPGWLDFLYYVDVKNS